MKFIRTRAAVFAAAVLLAACGGGGSDTSTDTQITSVQVVGDSLADVGTLGVRATVQGANSTMYPEHVARTYGIDALCPFYATTDGSTFFDSPTAGCTDYAIAGGRINNYTAPTSPKSIQVQLARAGTVAGTWKSTDMVLIDGGGNDAADLVGAYLRAGTDGGAAYLGLAGTLLDSTTISATLGQTNGQALLGGVYMQALANTFYASIKTHTLDKGAKHVVVINIPGITNTPRFQMVLDGVATAYGGGTTGATARAQAEGLFKGWIEAFNATLAAKVQGDARVVLVDIYTAFNNEVAKPAQYGLQNAKDAACPVSGLGSDGLPEYDFVTCTDTALSAATPPSGATGGSNWWKSYLFSDGFHPTPYGHQLMAQQISLDLAKAGRL